MPVPRAVREGCAVCDHDLLSTAATFINAERCVSIAALGHLIKLPGELISSYATEFNEKPSRRCRRSAIGGRTALGDVRMIARRQICQAHYPLVQPLNSDVHVSSSSTCNT